MKKDRIFWGIIFLFAAVFLIVGKLGYLGNFSMLSLVFTVFLIAIMIKSIPTMNFTGILFPIAFLCITYDKVLNIESLTPWTVLGVAFLGSIGLSLLFHNKRHHRHCRHFNVPVIEVEDNDHVKQRTTLGASTKYINSENFKQADLECSLGAMQIYFNKAKIETEAVVSIHANFSGIELYIPAEWKIENHIQSTLGAVDEKGQSSVVSEDAPVLKLVGDISFCGVEIIYV